jgi:hypothetical protein
MKGISTITFQDFAKLMSKNQEKSMYIRFAGQVNGFVEMPIFGCCLSKISAYNENTAFIFGNSDAENLAWGLEESNIRKIEKGSETNEGHLFVLVFLKNGDLVTFEGQVN